MSHPEHGDEPGEPEDRAVSKELAALAGLSPAMGGVILAIKGAGDLRRVRRLLTRVADAMELTAIINAQVSVPDHVGAKLDPWRDEILGRMAARYQRRASRKARVAGRPNGANEPASASSAQTSPCHVDSHPPEADAASTPPR